MAKKRIIICCDGTWNQPFQDDGSTNVAKTVRAISPSDGEGVPQIVYYDPGVGTGNWFDRLIGGGLGVGLSQNVQDGYLFIVANYQPGDEIYLFGFSRGAYTVRSLAGLIGTVGILHKSVLARFPDAYAYYRTPSAIRNGELKSRLLPAKRHENVPVKFLGVWDTRHNPPTVLYDSRKSWKWKFRRPLVRGVLATHPETERIHPSVLQCLQYKDGAEFDPVPYAPVNLADAVRRLKEKGDDLSRYVAAPAGRADLRLSMQDGSGTGESVQQPALLQGAAE